MANYAHIENNTITGVYDLIPSNWRNISNFYVLAENFDDIRSLGWRIVQKTPDPTINTDIERYGELSHAIVDDEVVETREVIALPVAPIVEQVVVELTEEEQLAAKISRHNNVMAELRTIRNQLLANTDYTQLNDTVVINGIELTQQFVNYRQLLRDLPNLYENDLDFNDINTVVYPIIPQKVVSVVSEETVSSNDSTPSADNSTPTEETTSSTDPTIEDPASSGV